MNIGIITRFISPPTVCVFWARETPRASPSPAKVSAPSIDTPRTSAQDPAIRTSNASQPNAKSTGTSMSTKSARMMTNDRRKSLRRIGVASIRLTSFFVRISTMRYPMPHMLLDIRLRPTRPGIRKSM